MLTLATDEIQKNTQHIASSLDINQKTFYATKICFLLVCHLINAMTCIQGTPRGLFRFLKLSQGLSSTTSPTTQAAAYHHLVAAGDLPSSFPGLLSAELLRECTNVLHQGQSCQAPGKGAQI